MKKVYLFASLFLANVIGIIMTSGGIGKKILSIMHINDKKNLALLCAASATVLLNKFLNIS